MTTPDTDPPRDTAPPPGGPSLTKATPLPPGEVQPPPAPLGPAGVPAGWGPPPSTAAAPVTPLTGILGALATAAAGGTAWALLLDYAHFTFSLIAVVIGSVVGGLLHRSLGANAVTAALAGLLTALACLAGEVVGTYAAVARDLHVSIADVRRHVSVGDVLSHMGGLPWIFVAAGVVFAVLAGLGRRSSFAGRRR